MNVVECDREILQKRLVRGLAMGKSAASARHYQHGPYRETDGKPHSHCAFLRNLTNYRLLPTAAQLGHRRRYGGNTTFYVAAALTRARQARLPSPWTGRGIWKDRERDRNGHREGITKKSQT